MWCFDSVLTGYTRNPPDANPTEFTHLVRHYLYLSPPTTNRLGAILVNTRVKTYTIIVTVTKSNKISKIIVNKYMYI